MKENKFKKGGKVFIGDVEYTDSYIACPDCLGTLKWLVVFADDTSEKVDCQTCKRGYEPPTGRIGIKNHRAVVREYTIGSVRYDDTNKEPYSYMCEETGVGSGRVYYENQISDNKEEALKIAKEETEKRMTAIANNNFSKKFGGTKDIENALSSYGFSRRSVLEKVRLFREWANLSKLI